MKVTEYPQLSDSIRKKSPVSSSQQWCTAREIPCHRFILLITEISVLLVEWIPSTLLRCPSTANQKYLNLPKVYGNGREREKMEDPLSLSLSLSLSLDQNSESSHDRGQWRKLWFLCTDDDDQYSSHRENGGRGRHCQGWSDDSSHIYIYICMYVYIYISYRATVASARNDLSRIES